MRPETRATRIRKYGSSARSCITNSAGTPKRFATTTSCSAYYLAETIRYFLRSLDPYSSGILPLFPVSRELVGYVQSRQDCDLHRVDGRYLRRNLPHPGIDEPRKLR